MTSSEILQGLPVIASLVVIEGLLSVDNVLGIAALAKELPENRQRKAIRLGLVGAYVFRVAALMVAGFLARNHWVRWLGAFYLVWLMCSHLTRRKHGDDGGPSHAVAATMVGVLMQIGLMDLSLSIDNVIAAVGLANRQADGSPVMWPIYVGVAFAILALQAIAPHAVRLLKRYPVLEPTAFILIGMVGGILIAEEAWHTFTGQVCEIPVYVKPALILMVIMIALFYSADPVVRRSMQPLIRISMPLMRAFAGLVRGIFFPLTWLCGKLRPE